MTRFPPTRDLAQRLAGRLSAGLGSWLGRRAGSSVGILVYHRVSPIYHGLPAPTMNVTPARFRTQLRGLLALGFRFWPLERLLEHHARGLAVPPRTVAVTFDDAFASVYHSAWPVLRELSVPATAFLATAFLDAERPFPFDPWGVSHAGRVPPTAYLPLSTEQCRQMLASGLVALGPHTHTHADFRGRPDAFAADLARSVAEVRSRFGARQAPFAFPFGRWHLGFVSDELMSAARRVGVDCALTTEAACVAPGDDPFGWGRFNAYDHDTAGTLAAKLEGWYGWAPQLQEWLAGRGLAQTGG